MPLSICLFQHVLLANRRRSPCRATRLSQRRYALRITIGSIYMQIAAASFPLHSVAHADAVREEIFFVPHHSGDRLLEEGLALDPVFLEEPLKTTALFARRFGRMRHIAFDRMHQGDQVGFFELVNVLFFGITE